MMTHNGKTLGGITGKGFVPGDPRCNRKGRSRSFDELRRVAQMIAGEDVVWADGSVISRAELLLRRWSRRLGGAPRGDASATARAGYCLLHLSVATAL